MHPLLHADASASGHVSNISVCDFVLLALMFWFCFIQVPAQLVFPNSASCASQEEERFASPAEATSPESVHGSVRQPSDGDQTAVRQQSDGHRAHLAEASDASAMPQGVNPPPAGVASSPAVPAGSRNVEAAAAAENLGAGFGSRMTATTVSAAEAADRQPGRPSDRLSDRLSVPYSSESGTSRPEDVVQEAADGAPSTREHKPPTLEQAKAAFDRGTQVRCMSKP